MQTQFKALLWAFVILIAAFVMKMNGLNEGASLAVVGGLSSAAWASIGIGKARTRSNRCLL